MTKPYNPAPLSKKQFAQTALQAQIDGLRQREKICWNMSGVFLHARNAHGLHDMGVEIQGIQWALRELQKENERAKP